MNKVLVVGVILLLTACGQFEAPPAPANTPELTVMESPSNNPEQWRKYIGSTHPPLPEGLSEGFGMLIQDVEGYALTLVIDGANKMLWLNKIARYDANGTAYWEVRDVLDLSNLEAGLMLIPDGCFLNGAPDSEILVAGKNGAIQLAWRANTTSDRFEVILTDGIECRSDKAINL